MHACRLALRRSAIRIAAPLRCCVVRVSRLQHSAPRRHLTLSPAAFRRPQTMADAKTAATAAAATAVAPPPFVGAAGAAQAQPQAQAQVPVQGLAAVLAQVVVPPLSGAKHKGQAGKVGVIGGCEEYTGAPYFAAMSALRAGADLSSVFCTPEAAAPIKSYSPELMVWPALRPPKAPSVAAQRCAANPSIRSADSKAELSREVTAVLCELAYACERVTCLSVGSGLGRTGDAPAAVMDFVARVPRAFPMILDADALVLLSAADCPARNAVGPGTVLTPNAMEFSRLFSSLVSKDEVKPITLDTDVNGKVSDALLSRIAQLRGSAPAPVAPAVGTVKPTAADGGGFVPWDHPWAIHASALALALGGATVVRKGAVDVITDGTTAMVVTAQGSARRCGGQGDVLAGVVAAFRGWAQPPQLSTALGNVLPPANGAAAPAASAPAPAVLSGDARRRVVLGAWAACVVLRACARRAGAKHPRSTIASDLLARVPEVMDELFPPTAVGDAPAAAAKL